MTRVAVSGTALRALLLLAVVVAVVQAQTAAVASPSGTSPSTVLQPPQQQFQPSQQQLSQQQPSQQQQPQQQQPQPFQTQLQPQSPVQLPLPLSPQNAVLLQCRQIVPSTDFDIAELQSQILPISQTGQCLLSCSAQRLGFMQPNYPIQLQGAGALMNALFPSRGFDPVFQGNLMATVNQCLRPGLGLDAGHAAGLAPGSLAFQPNPLSQWANGQTATLNAFNNVARQAANPLGGFLGR